MHKRGDTLIEVALAIGIFSLVAVAVVAVVSGSTSNAQSALELTLTREEIDAQAEAIRFIQTSYIAGGNVNVQNNTKYKVLWDQITKHAIDLNNTSLNAKTILEYNPKTCDDVYKNNNLAKQNAFVIDTRNLGLEYDSKHNKFKDASGNSTVDINKIVVDSKTKDVSFIAATTYPRMFYKKAGAEESDALLDRDTDTTLAAVEGIHVIAIKDNKSTVIINSSETSAYYDFYIRTCWYNPGASRPSTISTVIRLQDPSVIAY